MPNKKKGHPNEGSPKDFSDRDHNQPATTGQAINPLRAVFAAPLAVDLLLLAIAAALLIGGAA